MKFKMIKSLLVLLLASLIEVWGIELRMDRIYGNVYDRLFCDGVTTKRDKVLFSILEISIIDFTDPLNKLKLASSSALQTELHIENENGGSMKVSGGVSRYQANLDIRFSKKRGLEFGSFLCELAFIGKSGYIEKIHSALKPDLSDVNKDKLNDNSELILALQVNELRDQFADTVNLMTNRTTEIAESLVLLRECMEPTEPPSSNATCLPAMFEQENQTSWNKMANDTNHMKEGIDQVIEAMNLQRDQTDHLTSLTNELSGTVRYISDSVNTLKMRAQNNEDALAKLISQMEAIDAKFTSMTTKLDKLLEDRHPKVEPEVKTECYKGMPSGIASQRIPVLVMNKRTALCDTVTDNGGWIVIQRRVSGDVDFYRGWEDYKNGFGNVTTDYWLGNDIINQLTSLGNFQLRVDMMYQGKKYYAQYTTFSVGSESSNYTLSIGSYSGNAGDSLKHHNAMPFSTHDHDSNGNRCPARWHGAWWYFNCYDSNLNGQWGRHSNEGMTWHGIVGGRSIDFSEVKIRQS